MSYGWVKSFRVEPDGKTVIMHVHDPDEDQGVDVRVTHFELETMLAAKPYSGAPRLAQLPTNQEEPS